MAVNIFLIIHQLEKNRCESEFNNIVPLCCYSCGVNSTILKFRMIFKTIYYRPWCERAFSLILVYRVNTRLVLFWQHCMYLLWRRSCCYWLCEKICPRWWTKGDKYFIIRCSVPPKKVCTSTCLLAQQHANTKYLLHRSSTSCFHLCAVFEVTYKILFQLGCCFTRLEPMQAIDSQAAHQVLERSQCMTLVSLEILTINHISSFYVQNGSLRFHEVFILQIYSSLFAFLLFQC